MIPKLEDVFEHTLSLSSTKKHNTDLNLEAEIKTFKENLAQYLKSQPSNNIDFSVLTKNRINTIDDDFLTTFLELFNEYLKESNYENMQIIFPELPKITKYGEDALERFSFENPEIKMNLGTDVIGPILDKPLIIPSNIIIEIPNTVIRTRKNALSREGVLEALKMLEKIPSANQK